MPTCHKIIAKMPRSSEPSGFGPRLFCFFVAICFASVVGVGWLVPSPNVLLFFAAALCAYTLSLCPQTFSAGKHDVLNMIISALMAFGEKEMNIRREPSWLVLSSFRSIFHPALFAVSVLENCGCIGPERTVHSLRLC